MPKDLFALGKANLVNELNMEHEHISALLANMNGDRVWVIIYVPLMALMPFRYDQFILALISFYLSLFFMSISLY